MALQPRSRRPKTSPTALHPGVVDLIVRVRKELTDAGLDAGPETIAWHLEHHHDHRVSRSTISRYLTTAGLVTPEPKKRPKSSYIRFQASLPNETWQSDFTHYRLTRPDGRPGNDAEIISWLDDCTRYALHVSAHRAITTALVTATFRETAGQHGIPASTLTDNGMVYTVRLASIGRRGGRNAFEQQLRTWNVVQKNSRPSHPSPADHDHRAQPPAHHGRNAPGRTQDPDQLPDSGTLTANRRSRPCPGTPARHRRSEPACVEQPRRPHVHSRVRRAPRPVEYATGPRPHRTNRVEAIVQARARGVLG